MTKTSCVVAGHHLVFHCDADRHAVVVTDPLGNVQWCWGHQGEGPGAFNTPLDLTLVRPEFDGERLPADGDDAAWVAVADYGNGRVQIFELDGSLVATIPVEPEAFGPPCALKWAAPFLEIEGVEGARRRVHLSGRLLWGDRPQPPVGFMFRLSSTRSTWGHN